MTDNNENQQKVENEGQVQKTFDRLTVIDLIKLFHVKHDAFFKYVFGLVIFARVFAQALFKLKFPNFSLLLDFNQLQVITVPLKDNAFHEHMPDLVYYIPFKEMNFGIQLRVILEHKSYKDRMTVFQTARYSIFSMMEEWRQAIQLKVPCFFFSPTMGVIINQAPGKNFKGPSRLKDLYHKIMIPKDKKTPEMRGELKIIQKSFLNMEPVIINLQDPNPNTLLSDKDAPELLYIMRIMQSIHDPEINDITMEALLALQPYAGDLYYKLLADAIFAYVVSNSTQITEDNISSLCDVFYLFNKKRRKKNGYFNR